MKRRELVLQLEAFYRRLAGDGADRRSLLEKVFSLVAAERGPFSFSCHELESLPVSALDDMGITCGSEYKGIRKTTFILQKGRRWLAAPIPKNEAHRLALLNESRILDSKAEERYDRITRSAATIFNAPIALISLVDKDRQWFKSSFGLNAKETSRDLSFCAHVVCSCAPMIVEDTFSDIRFADNPLVTGEPRIRFYAGYPLLVDGCCIGTLCVIDSHPRALDRSRLDKLHALADIVVDEINMTPIVPDALSESQRAQGF